jgi:hypothetical protein
MYKGTGRFSDTQKSIHANCMTCKSNQKITYDYLFGKCLRVSRLERGKKNGIVATTNGKLSWSSVTTTYGTYP